MVGAVWAPVQPRLLLMSDRYQIKEKIGQGGLGEVFVAVDTHLQREVALKRVKTVEGQSPDDVLREARVLSALQHPNILTVYDVGQDLESPFIVTELLRGDTLEGVVARGPLRYEEFRQLALQSLEGLVAAQAMDLVHRDLKPENLMLIWHASGRFQVKILDFGLAKFSRHASRQTEDQESGIMGSIHFMAPEQFERLPLDGRTDLYALGCLFYYALAGRNPFEGETAPVIMASHLAHYVTALGQIRPDLPPWVCDWVMWFINRQPASRPSSARDALETFQQQSQAWETAMQAAPLAAAMAAAAAAAPAAPARAPARAPVGRAAEAPVRGPAARRPPAASVAGGPLAAAGGRKSGQQRPAVVPRASPWWLLYGFLPTLLSLVAAYGLWKWKQKRDQEAVRAAAQTSVLTAESMVFPDDPGLGRRAAGPKASLAIRLPIEAARIVGSGARRRGSVPAIGHWQSVDTRVVWEVVIDEPGRYEVMVSQSVDDPAMGGRYQVSLAGGIVEGVVRPGPGKETFTDVSLGVLTVAEKGPQVLEIKPLAVNGASLMNLGGITLLRK